LSQQEPGGLLSFIEQSPTPFHCVETAAERLKVAGYEERWPGDAPAQVEPGAGGFLRRGGTLLAWRGGRKGPAEGGFRVLGAHTDSPDLRLKPLASQASDGYRVWGVEPYGGGIWATWADRDLGLAGRVAVRTEAGSELRLVRVDRPIARVPSVAIHLNREVNDKGYKLNAESQLPPMVGIAAGDEGDGRSLEQLLARELGCAVADLLAFDLSLYDLQAPSVGGLDGEFVFAPRLDNQASCHCAVEALVGLKETPDATSVVALFDHEECGSSSERGADSAMLAQLLAGLVRDHAEEAPGGLERAAANSFVVSSDMAHALHPGYTDKHDKQHRPRMNGGPVIKTNVNMRYATDASTAARFRLACVAQDVPVQDFVNRADLRCGSTIGPMTAAGLAIPTVDVGGAMLSMHSIREQGGSRDVQWMIAAMREVLRDG